MLVAGISWPDFLDSHPGMAEALAGQVGAQHDRRRATYPRLTVGDAGGTLVGRQ
jgi:hypothetical protein